MEIAIGGFCDWACAGADVVVEEGFEVEEEDEAGRVLWRSPRMQTSAWMTVRPPRTMFCVPWIWARRETLLPVSWGVRGLVSLVAIGVGSGTQRWEGKGGVRFRCIRL